MNTNSDFRQEAALKCLAANKLNTQDPYSGPYYRHAYKSVQIDSFRQQESRGRRIINFFDTCPTANRYDADKRFRRDGIESDDPSKQAEAREELELTIASLSRCRTEIRNLMAGHFLDGKTSSELARELGLTNPTIRNRIYRERWRIKRELGTLGITA